MIKNGYPPEKIVFGMISSQFNSSNMNDACDTIKLIKQKYDHQSNRHFERLICLFRVQQ